MPESFDFGMPSVELIGVGSKGLDKTAMVKRASAFDDVVSKLEKKANRTYLHVITTGAFEQYGPNKNGDAWCGTHMIHTAPHPENSKTATVHFDGGLSKYHDDTYMKGGAVYQEHQTKRAGVEPSGEIICARYNDDMHRGELIIAVDTDKWSDRLQKKASGQDIYLSIGADVPYDTCMICHRQAKTASQHCEHFTHNRNRLYKCGHVSCVMNDVPSFYDISGVNVPADKIAFVLQKVASGEDYDSIIKTANYSVVSRPPMPFGKSAAILSKLSKMEKQIQGLVESTSPDLEAFDEDKEDKDNFILKVENYPSDEVIASCNRKGILLSPELFFKLIGKECEDENDKQCFSLCSNSSCGDMSCMMQELEEADDLNDILSDGSFDSKPPVDLNLDRIISSFIPGLASTNPAVTHRSITITIHSIPKERQHKEASFNKVAQQALRRTYSRYLISFAEANDDSTCMNALMKVAGYCK